MRPHLEYAVSSWFPYFKKDIKELEKVQKRAIKLIPELKHLDYPHRLDKLNLTDLRTRRQRGDLIQMYKLVNKLEALNLVNGLNFSLVANTGRSNYNLRRHSKTIHREQVKNCLPRFHFFINRVVNCWNQLPKEVIEARSLNSLKSKLDCWMAKNRVTTAIAQ